MTRTLMVIALTMGLSVMLSIIFSLYNLRHFGYIDVPDSSLVERELHQHLRLLSVETNRSMDNQQLTEPATISSTAIDNFSDSTKPTTPATLTNITTNDDSQRQLNETLFFANHDEQNANNFNNNNTNNEQQQQPQLPQNTTKIVAFFTVSYAEIAIRWYDRLTTLGYDNHVLICSDNLTSQFLKDYHPDYRTETVNATLQQHQAGSRKFRQRLFALRWIHILEQLTLGYHILLTDVDNIFSSYYSLKHLEDSDVHAYLALETKYPTHVFDALGFTVCGGMGWYRSAPQTIEFVQKVVGVCNGVCDDQVALNEVIADHMNIEWYRSNKTEDLERTVASIDTNETIRGFGTPYQRLEGLLTKGFSGYSHATGAKIQVWDRDFAYRGRVNPSLCPQNNWVSMPIIITGTAIERRKRNSFDVWDESCPNEYTTIRQQQASAMGIELRAESPQKFEFKIRSVLHKQVFGGNLTEENQWWHLNKTKIVSFVRSPAYWSIAQQWYDRLEALGYNNHGFVCSDDETCQMLRSNYSQYRVEESRYPPLTAAGIDEFETRLEKMKLRRLLAHRWVYILEQLKLGYHVLLSEVNHIFSTFYNMNALELSRNDIFLAMETRNPTDVFDYQGFTISSGLGWFRASIPTIRVLQEVVNVCGIECDDHIVFNRILAYTANVAWIRNGTEHLEKIAPSIDTNETVRGLGSAYECLVGLPTKGFAGYSFATGAQVEVWDRDFAYQGKVNPSQCPENNWVSMPLIIAASTQTVMRRTRGSFDVWDESCPNEYSTTRRAVVIKNADNNGKGAADIKTPIVEHNALVEITAPASDQSAEFIDDFQRSILSQEAFRGNLTQLNQLMHLNKTKIVSFVRSPAYWSIAQQWYDRLEALGYNNHGFVCSDDETCQMLRSNYSQYRVEESRYPPLTAAGIDEFDTRLEKMKLRRLLAHRWVYILEQLKLGYHVLLSEVNHIFSTFYNMNALELSRNDIFLAMETRNPTDVFDYQGFTISSGLGWFRASIPTIRVLQEVVNVCGIECDDHIVFNRILAYTANVTWIRNGTKHLEKIAPSIDTNETVRGLGSAYERLVGLPTKGFTGYSFATGAQIEVWDRDFAYQGKVNPSQCPENNWVSMPLIIAASTQTVMRRTRGSFDVWDESCPNEYSSARRSVISRQVILDEISEFRLRSLLHNESFQGNLTKKNQMWHLNRTKIVGLVSGSFHNIAIQWYDRLTALGYKNQYLVCTDEESCQVFRANSTQYRFEERHYPPLTHALAGIAYQDIAKKRIQRFFAHRWVYTLEQLKLGHHVLLTDVDNIFSTYYNMNDLELSEHDICHALETRFPQDVFDFQGFTICGGMSWFRASAPTIRVVEEMVNLCGIECDDQIVLNRILAYGMNVEWHHNGTSSLGIISQTNETADRFAGLVSKGFTGYSASTGANVRVWDRDFAYRGPVNPIQCPHDNWVSMPIMPAWSRTVAARNKERSFQLWDEMCPNAYSRLMLQESNRVQL